VPVYIHPTHRRYTVLFTIIIHFNNSLSIRHPRLWYWTPYSDSGEKIKPRGEDAFGYFFEVTSARSEFYFKFRSGIDTKEFWEDDSLNRFYTWHELEDEQIRPDEIWCVGHNAFVYHVLPQPAEAESAEEFLKELR
jgi:hypothetical protein